MNKFFSLIGAVILIMGGLYLASIFLPKSPQSDQSPGHTQEDEEERQLREIAITGGEFYFTPTQFSVFRGERLRIVFSNVGALPHDLKIEGLGEGTPIISPGETTSFVFTAPSEATVVDFTIFCSVPGHREAGMEGKVIVE